MSKVGVTVVRPDVKSPLSLEFGLAGWVLICDLEGKHYSFERNGLLCGMGVVGILRQHRCTDTIFSSIGQSALEALQASKIRGWLGPEGIPAAQLIERLKRSELKEVGSDACDHRTDADAAVRVASSRT